MVFYILTQRLNHHLEDELTSFMQIVAELHQQL